MIFISLLVHEKPDVVLNQLKNIQHFFPDACVVIHVSPVFPLMLDQFRAKLAACDLDLHLIIINPQQVKTSWGSIINAHLSNIRFIQSMGGAKSIVFHSSNDMLVKSGVQTYVMNQKNAFNLRKVFPGSHWWVGQNALQDTTFTRCLANAGSGLVIGSQVEGSFYEADLLFDIADELEKFYFPTAPSLFYPREEIFFSSFALKRNIKPDAYPYVFSDVHVFDARLWEYFDTYPRLMGDHGFIKRQIKRLVNKILFESRFYKITKRTVDQLIANKEVKNTLNDGHGRWQLYSPEHIYAVKRVDRDMKDPVRCYISSLYL